MMVAPSDGSGGYTIDPDGGAELGLGPGAGRFGGLAQAARVTAHAAAKAAGFEDETDDTMHLRETRLSSPPAAAARALAAAAQRPAMQALCLSRMRSAKAT
ncbi:hypothetical protein OOZ51_13830 [Arthrobacter sp. MI7-26]|nr:hypothetical protein [Arthrobacter sp. MI7-26]